MVVRHSENSRRASTKQKKTPSSEKKRSTVRQWKRNPPETTFANFCSLLAGFSLRIIKFPTRLYGTRGQTQRYDKILFQDYKSGSGCARGVYAADKDSSRMVIAGLY